MLGGRVEAEQVVGDGRRGYRGDLRDVVGGGDLDHVHADDGKTGEVAISTEAQVDAASGLVTMFQREVTTRLGDTTRVTLETWTLAPKG